MRGQAFWLAWVFCFALPLHGNACTTPVFRFALENWSPSAYLVHVFHQGTLTPAQLALLEGLESRQTSVNLQVRRHDVNRQLSKDVQALYDKLARGKEPCLIVQPPEEEEGFVLHVAPLSPQSVQQITQSPARKELVKRLTKGDSAVWLVLAKSGDSEGEKQTALVKQELTRLEKAIELPAPDPTFPLRCSLPLVLRFSVLSLDPQDPQEKFLVESLKYATGVNENSDQTIVFPVMGRGRVVSKLQGKEIRPATMERWASFLCGPCSCRVKELNPGMDLLLTASWKDLLELKDDPVSENVLDNKPSIPPGEIKDKEARKATGSLLWLWFVLGGSATVALGSALWGWGKRVAQESPSTASTTQQPR